MTQQFCTYTAHAVFPGHNGLIIHTQQRSIGTYVSQAVCMHMVNLVLENVLCLCKMSSAYDGKGIMRSKEAKEYNWVNVTTGTSI